MAEEEKNRTKVFNKNTDLTEDQQESFDYFNTRIAQLHDFRKNHYGVDLDQLWAEADRDYVPHRLGTASKRVIATDEERGWRGTLVRLGSTNWQSDLAQSNPFIKIQTALSILIDQNPSGVFSAGAKKFQATTELIRQLYQRSWEIARSKSQLKLFVYNMAKYGWACARTYPLRKVNTIKVLVEYNQEDPEKSVYKEKDVVEYNDIMRENLDPRNTWMDDMARPNDAMSVRDWSWRKVYPMSTAKALFGKYKRWEFVQKGGNTEETIGDKKDRTQEKTETDLVEVYFYESKEKDLFMVIANSIPVVIDPLPISDEKGNKKLSLWQGYWNVRHAESPYGIGVYESIRYDSSFLDRIRNMTIDQLVLSIYKMFFYQGTQALTDTGEITITPGKGKQILDPKNLKWLEVPGPGKDAYVGIEMFKKDIDEASGITDPLIGEVTGKTAFELAQAKESALKRMKTPLSNILDALDTEGYITIYLIQLLYSQPEVYQIADPVLADRYLKEINSDPELYERNEQMNEETGELESVLSARVFPELPLNLEEGKDGTLIETDKTRFFRIKPRFLKWEGIITIKSQSLLTPSKQIDKALDLEMYQILLPLMAQPQELYKKAAENIVKLYDKEPKDILPDFWYQQEQQQGDQLFAPAVNQQVSQPAQQIQQPQPPVGNLPTQSGRGGLVSRIMNRLSAPFKRV